MVQNQCLLNEITNYVTANSTFNKILKFMAVVY
jgi:hypothetical protein